MSRCQRGGFYAATELYKLKQDEQRQRGGQRRKTGPYPGLPFRKTRLRTNFNYARLKQNGRQKQKGGAVAKRRHQRGTVPYVQEQIAEGLSSLISGPAPGWGTAAKTIGKLGFSGAKSHYNRYIKG